MEFLSTLCNVPHIALPAPYTLSSKRISMSEKFICVSLVSFSFFLSNRSLCISFVCSIVTEIVSMTFEPCTKTSREFFHFSFSVCPRRQKMKNRRNFVSMHRFQSVINATAYGPAANVVDLWNANEKLPIARIRSRALALDNVSVDPCIMHAQYVL